MKSERSYWQIPCAFCGNMIFVSCKKRGRPKEYCNNTCGDGKKFLNAFLNVADKTDFTESARKALRGDLLAFVNTNLHNNKKLNLSTKNN